MHNSAAFLTEAIESVLSQTYEDYELIIIDDCSTDDTLRIAYQYAEIDIRIKIARLLVCSGPAAARNVGIRMVGASG